MTKTCIYCDKDYHQSTEKSQYHYSLAPLGVCEECQRQLDASDCPDVLRAIWTIRREGTAQVSNR